MAAQSLVWDTVMDELVDGQKRTHWIWYVFPQEARLGQSHNAKYYGVKSNEEAEAYLAHPLLGQRLRVATILVRGHLELGSELEDILNGAVDAAKFRSCMALFARISGEEFFRELA